MFEFLRCFQESWRPKDQYKNKNLKIKWIRHIDVSELFVIFRITAEKKGGAKLKLVFIFRVNECIFIGDIKRISKTESHSCTVGDEQRRFSFCFLSKCIISKEVLISFDWLKTSLKIYRRSEKWRRRGRSLRDSGSIASSNLESEAGCLFNGEEQRRLPWNTSSLDR